LASLQAFYESISPEIIAATNAKRIRQHYMIAADIPRHPSFGRAPRRSTIRESIAATTAQTPGISVVND
jgi:hypothetical protein